MTINFATGKVESYYKPCNFELLNYIIINKLENFIRWQGRDGYISKINGKTAILWGDSNKIEIL